MFALRLSLFILFPLSYPALTHADPSIQTKTLFNGTMSTDVSWTTNPENGFDVLRGKITFLPNQDSASECSLVRMIQIARVLDSSGNEFIWNETSGGESSRNLIKTVPSKNGTSEIKGGYFLDHEAVNCEAGKPCSPYFRDSWPNPTESQDGSNQCEKGPIEASLIDYPYGWSMDGFNEIDLEACARCDDTGQFLGCVSWGARWPAMGDRTIFQAEFSENPSATFTEAFDRFTKYYSETAPSEQKK